MWIGTISLMPEMFQALNHGVTGRAINNGLLSVSHWQLRDFTEDTHKTVDDRPYGGGPGMVMKAEPIYQAIQAAKKAAPSPAKVVYLSPQGRPFNQNAAKSMAQAQTPIILLAGRYEGIDERVIDLMVDEEWSIGDYVLSGGELAGMVMIDAIARLNPGVLGHEESAEQDSFMDNLLDHPHYTRPDQWRDTPVPEVLLNGDHQAIADWRLQQRIVRTWQRNPSLLNKRSLNEHEQHLLSNFLAEHNVGEHQ
jgi:tRNA (guanine37-N1)-methyltransferase